MVKTIWLYMYNLNYFMSIFHGFHNSGLVNTFLKVFNNASLYVNVLTVAEISQDLTQDALCLSLCTPWHLDPGFRVTWNYQIFSPLTYIACSQSNPRNIFLSLSLTLFCTYSVFIPPLVKTSRKLQQWCVSLLLHQNL